MLMALSHLGRFKTNCYLMMFQQVQNTLAKIVLNNSALPSIIALHQLHWLPVKQRNHFKIATLTYRALQLGSPSYLSSLINLNDPPRPLRSVSLSLLHVPFTAKPSGSQLLRFGTLFHKISGYYHPLPPSNAVSKLLSLIHI